jgi:hypothetical protein
MPKKMIELTAKQCKQVTGGSGYLISTGRTGETTTTSSSSTTDRSGYILAGN